MFHYILIPLAQNRRFPFLPADLEMKGYACGLFVISLC